MSDSVFRGKATLHLLTKSSSGPTVQMNQPGGTTALTGYVTPITESISIVHSGTVERGMQYGDIVALHGGGEVLECRFTFVPCDTETAITTASAKSLYDNAELAAGVPQLLSTMSVSNLPIIVMGKFVDAYNTNGTNTQPWFYEGGAELGGDGINYWTLTASFFRFFNIGTHVAPGYSS